VKKPPGGNPALIAVIAASSSSISDKPKLHTAASNPPSPRTPGAAMSA
jgi:hypothetical protein